MIPIGRYRVYFRRMFPLPLLIPWGVSACLGVYFTLQMLGEQSSLRFTWRAAAACVTVVLFSLLMRIYDELKDAEGDLQLAAAGDPNYQDRPIVTGEITVDDLRLLRWWVTVALVGLNLPLGFPYPLLGFLVTFFFTWLSFKWFFCAAISKNLLLAFVTHNPLVLLISGYTVTVYIADFGAQRLTGWTVPLLLGTWAPVAAWETSRKIRLPEDETIYQTYSKLLGWRTATLLPLLFVLVSVVCLLPVCRAAGLGWAFPTLLLTGASVVIGACVALLISPNRQRTKLRPYTELYALMVNAGLTLTWLARDWTT